jgi:nucleoside-diphosphate-sugar epimerase
MNILITGAAGFIGSKLKAALENSHNVIGHTRENYNIEDLNFDKLSVQNFDIIYHLASTTHNYHILDNPYIDINTNCKGTINLLENMRFYCPKAKLVFVSTFFVNSGEPLGLYGASKLFAEHACRIYSKVFDLNVSIARLCNVYGPGERIDNNKKNAFMKILYQLHKNEPVLVYKEDSWRDFIYIDDVLSALQTIAAVGQNRQIYTVGTGTKLLFRNLITMIKDVIGSTSKIEYVDSPTFHKAVGMEDLEYDVKPLRKLGWEPTHTVVDGVSKILAEHKNFQ